MLKKYFTKANNKPSTGKVAEAAGHAEAMQAIPEGCHAPQTARQLLEPRLAAINRIEALAGLPDAHFRRYYLACLENYASFVQLLPASEAHHHGHAGGMLDHCLEAVTDALTLRQGYLLPPDTPVEDIVHLKDLWTYAVFTAALCHDLGKPAVDQKITLFDSTGQSLGQWNPWQGNMDSSNQAFCYQIEFVRKREYRLHEKASLLLAHRVVPACGLSWLASDRQAFSAWLSCLAGQYHEAEALGEIVSLADRHSVAKDLGAEPKAQAAKAPAMPLHEKLLMALRQLLEDNALPLNRNGAAGWRKDNKLWLVSKRAVDSMRLYLSQSGHAGIPTDNQRMFDVLQEHRILEPCQDRAIWRTRVRAADGSWGHELTLICIPLANIWQDPEAWPEEFSGSIKAADTEEEGMADTALSTASSKNVDSSFVKGGIEAPNVDSPSQSTDSNPYNSKPKPQGGLEVSLNNQNDDAEPTLVADAVSDLDDEVSGHISKRISAKPDHAGFIFLKWVIEGVENRTLAFNQPNARVQVVEGGVLLVSPGIFQDYVKHAKLDVPWETIQKKFCKLGVHKRTEGGLNIHPYQVSGKHRSGKVMAHLLEDTGLVFREVKPKPNPHVSGIRTLTGTGNSVKG